MTNPSQTGTCILPRETEYSDTSGWRRINSAIFNINNRLTRLAGLGRPGQWVVHNEDLYETEIDTRPHSRNRDEEIPICGLDYKGFLIKDRGIIWAGKKPSPDFQNALSWESKADELETKIKEIEAGLLDHQFTPEELARIEAMERQEVPENPERSPIRGFTLGNVQSNAEYFWAGKGQPPDFEDHLYWKRKANELTAKWQEIKDGQVHPQFTQEELSALQLMEHNEAHFFCISERLRREKPTIRPLTPSSRDASEELKLARSLVWCEMTNLWGLGLPGKWVLHHEDIYLPECDTRCRDDDESFPIPPIAAHEGFEKSDFGLRYDGDLPLPDFNDLAYWEAKLEKLKKRLRRSREGASGRKPMGDVDAWLGRQNDPQAQPNSTQSSQADVTWQTTWLPSRAGSPISIHSRRACSADSTGDSSFGDKRLQLLRVRDRVLNRAQELSKLGSETRQVVEGCGFRFQHTLSIDLENTTFNSIKMDGRDTWYTAQEVEPRYDSAAFWEKSYATTGYVAKGNPKTTSVNQRRRKTSSKPDKAQASDEPIVRPESSAPSSSGTSHIATELELHRRHQAQTVTATKSGGEGFLTAVAQCNPFNENQAPKCKRGEPSSTEDECCS
ncbi:hypothetical protein V8F06_014591 [Rhypophila decipiens]